MSCARRLSRLVFRTYDDALRHSGLTGSQFTIPVFPRRDGSVAESKNTRDYHNQITDAEPVSMWQSLSFGANSKAAYCLAVCPAGDDMIGSYLADKKEFQQLIARPLTIKSENRIFR